MGNKTVETKKGEINWLTLISGIMLVIGGFIAFYRPGASLVVIAMYLGISVLLAGITTIAAYLTASKVTAGGVKPPVAILVIGILDILFGLIMLSNSIITAAALPTVVGIWIILSAVSKFLFAYQVRKDNKGAFVFSILLGILSLFAAYIFLFSPVIGAFSIVYCLGMYFIVAGIVNISTSLR